MRGVDTPTYNSGCRGSGSARRDRLLTFLILIARRRLTFQEVSTMRYLKIVLLLLGVTVGTQACIIPVPVGGGGGHRHHHDEWR